MKKLLALVLALLPLGVTAATQTIFGAPTTSCADTGGQHANYSVAASGLTTFSCGTSGSAGGNTQQVAQWGVPYFLPPSGFFANNGKVVFSQAPASSATATFGATSGSTTVTFSAATLLGTASDVTRIITILDTTYKYCTITAQSSTTVATCTISGGSLSGTGPFANNAVWISGATGGTASYSTMLPTVLPNAYAYFPVNVISASTAAGFYYMQCESTTVCTVFNNVLASGLPLHISSPTAFSTTGTGAFTQTTGSSLGTLSATVVGGSMGTGGSVKIALRGVAASDANTKTISTGFGGQAWSISTQTTNGYLPVTRTISNIDSASAQFLFTNVVAALTDETGPSSPAYLAVNTASDVAITATLKLATATDWVGIMSGTITLNTAP